MSVEPVDLTPGKRRRITLCNYGASRSGKTQLAATFPRPLFLSDKGESGWETIRYMPVDLFYEPNHRTPSGLSCEVWPISTAQEMLESIPVVAEILRKEPDRWGTLVVDSLTFYADSYFAQLELNYRKAMGQKYDPRRAFQDLGSHLRWIMIRLHEITEPLGVNVVWLALEKPPQESGDPGGILLSGQSALKTPARCDGLLYQRHYRAGADTVYEVHAQPFGIMPAGGRGFQVLPCPMVSPTYRDFEALLGIVPRYGTTAKEVKAA
jgi:AAA domain-containing protein